MASHHAALTNLPPPQENSCMLLLLKATENIHVINPGAVIYYEKQLHEASISFEERVYPFIITMFISEQNNSKMLEFLNLH